MDQIENRGLGLGAVIQAENGWLLHTDLTQGWPKKSSMENIFPEDDDLGSILYHPLCVERGVPQNKDILKFVGCGEWLSWLIRVAMEGVRKEY